MVSGSPFLHGDRGEKQTCTLAPGNILGCLVTRRHCEIKDRRRRARRTGQESKRQSTKNRKRADQKAGVRTEDRIHTTLGTGSADFNHALAAIKEINFTGPLIMQAFRDNLGTKVLLEQLGYLRKLGW